MSDGQNKKKLVWP